MDGTIIPTDGFGVFRNKDKQALLRTLAQKTPLILLTDSDGAGKIIRAHLKGIVSPERLIQLYIPKIYGKEKRKERPSAEGTLGVEGMEQLLLYDLLAPYQNDRALRAAKENPLSKTDFFLDGLTGGENSTARRDDLAAKLGLPDGMTPNALLAAVRLLCSYEKYCALVGREQTPV